MEARFVGQVAVVASFSLVAEADPRETHLETKDTIHLFNHSTYLSYSRDFERCATEQNSCSNSGEGNHLYISKSEQSQGKLFYLWAEAVAAEAEEGFGGEGPERQQTAGPAVGKEGGPGPEH